MIYIIVIAVGIAIGVYCSKKIDENYANGVYDQAYNDEQEMIEPAENYENNDFDTNEESTEESMEQEIERLRKENELLKQSQKGE
ncbi:hypothetical protein K0O13_08055 [Mammaliicoccus sciuri]|uniref:hypothetical protein n=1 Tax=Mammaliicoccus sciuri TaxID=1296 RepID=UPI001C62665B|nr:hypothetical protein [Mammaliicoccus sciuri]QYG30053.1 hypothetical protein K0O13_08055 [Mammaliicoccus sciuri]